MSVKHALLALLDQGPRHGYGLKHEFEARLGEHGHRDGRLMLAAQPGRPWPTPGFLYFIAHK